VTGRILLTSLLAVGLSFAGPAWPAQTRVWTERPETLEKGEAQGIALTARGVLYPAPRLVRLGEGRTPGDPDHVWSMARDDLDNIYVGTGPAGQIIRITPSGQHSLFYTVDEPLVSALAVDRSGRLLAGTSPGGKIHRILPDGTGSMWSETGERYVWALAVGSDGTVYAGTGERGTVLEINPSGSVSTFFDSDEPHVVSLFPTPDGGLLAGGSGRGLVYRIDGDGNGIVLYEDELPEVTALSIDANRNVLAALVAPPLPESERPEVSLRLPDGVEVGRTDENVARLEESTGPVLRGYIEGLAREEEDEPTRPRGRVVRISATGEVEQLWRSTAEAPFSLISDGDDVVFGAGEPARLYRIPADGDIALLATLREAQVTELLAVRRSIVFATSNPAAAYQLDPGTAETGTFVSQPFDAGGQARWGAIRWTIEEGVEGPRVELYTRTGNSRSPDGTWSAWGPAMTDPVRSRVVNPDGRYLQWRARFVGARPEANRLSSIRVHYETYNRPPQIRDLALGGEDPWVADKAGLSWSAFDPDGDPVATTLEYRAAAGGPWTALAVPDSKGAGSDESPQGWREERFEWDTTGIDEGEYEVRLSASDRAVNTVAEGRTVVTSPPLRLVVDRTPPRFELRPTGPGRFELTLEDAHSEIRRLQLLTDGIVLHGYRPIDGVCDSLRESFSIELPGDPEEHRLRGADAAGNHVDIPLEP
jgi:hypothetical protein